MNIDINDLPEEITIDVVPMLSQYGTVMLHGKMMESYTRLGDTVQVTFKLHSRDTLINNTVDNLKKKALVIRADAEVEIKSIEKKINTLLALENLP